MNKGSNELNEHVSVCLHIGVWEMVTQISSFMLEHGFAESVPAGML